MICKKCGENNGEKAKFCGNCGSPLEAEPQKTKKKPYKVLIIVACFVIVAAVIISAFTVEAKIREGKYQNCITKAENYLEAFDYENAVEMYLMAIKIDPKQKKPYEQLAEIFVLQEQYDEAIEILEKGEKKVSKEKDSLSAKKKEIKNGGKYTWAVKPTIEADDINYITDQSYGENTLNGVQLQYMSPYAVIEKGGNVSLIDMGGRIIGSFNYQQVGCWYGYMYTLSNDNRTDCLEHDKLEPLLGIGDGGPQRCAYYWCSGLHHIDENTSWEDLVCQPYTAIPVKQSNDIITGDHKETYLKWKSLPGGYAICKDDQLVTDFIYDKCGSLSDGVFAVCKDGKWGYVDEQGNEVIPMEYDSSWKKDIEQYYYGNDEEEEFCYSASDGYIPLVKGGKWELRDVTGKLTVLPGVFEEIRPVYDGKCWVKKNGKWGVIKLEDESNDE